jgi:hypothetical protein
MNWSFTVDLDLSIEKGVIHDKHPFELICDQEQQIHIYALALNMYSSFCVLYI